MLQVKVYLTLELGNGRLTNRADRRVRMANRFKALPLYHPQEGTMTPILLLVAFLLVLDVLVLLGRSDDSRDGRDWQPRGSPSPGPSAVAPI